jgi:rare lipoprotein A
MPRAILRIRQLHEAGGALKSSAETVSISLDSRKRVSRRQPRYFSHFSHTLLLVLFVLCVVCVYSSGCASRRPIADRRQPPPSQPSETPAGAADAAKRSTDIPEPAPAPAAAAPSPKRSKPAPAPVPSGYTEEGNASWYGVPFHGRHASNGEIYDMYKLTAAHRTLPFETMVRVTNLNNGKSTVVRITDRGPFVDNRIIDLSLAAAREVDSMGAGVVPVRVEVLGGVDPTAGFFTVQVGAFRDRANAERLRDRLSASYSPIFIQQYDSPDGIFYRVRVGKISGEDAAHQFGEQLRDHEGFTPLVTRLDEGTPVGGNR